MKILITGSSGLVGKACVHFFMEKGWEVVGIDNNGRSKFFGTESRFNDGEFASLHTGAHWQGYDVDVHDEEQINGLFIHSGPFDAIIHAAAQPSHDYATDHVLEDFDVNARGTLILLEATRKYCPDAVFVYVSTDKVYGENMSASYFQMNYTNAMGEYMTKPMELIETKTRYTFNSPGFDENLGLDFAGDRSFFGCSKAAADMYAQQYAARGMTVGIFRPGCITGKNHAGAEQHGFLAYLAKCYRDEKVYKIFGHKGKQVRDQIHANDLAAVFHAFIERPNAGAVYNMGGGPERSVSILEAIKLIEEAAPGKKLFVEFHEARKGDRVWDVHDVSKFRKDYPEWDYKYSLADIISDLVS